MNDTTGIFHLIMDADHDDDALTERVLRKIERQGWDKAEEALIEVMKRDHLESWKYEVAASFLTNAAIEYRFENGPPLKQPNLVIGLLYKRLLPEPGSDENNQAWTTASALKGVDYLDDSYDPVTDPAVITALREIGLELTA